MKRLFTKNGEKKSLDGLEENVKRLISDNIDAFLSYIDDEAFLPSTKWEEENKFNRIGFLKALEKLSQNLRNINQVTQNASENFTYNQIQYSYQQSGWQGMNTQGEQKLLTVQDLRDYLSSKKDKALEELRRLISAQEASKEFLPTNTIFNLVEYMFDRGCIGVYRFGEPYNEWIWNRGGVFCIDPRILRRIGINSMLIGYPNVPRGYQVDPDKNNFSSDNVSDQRMQEIFKMQNIFNNYYNSGMLVRRQAPIGDAVDSDKNNSSSNNTFLLDVAFNIINALFSKDKNNNSNVVCENNIQYIKNNENNENNKNNGIFFIRSTYRGPQILGLGEIKTLETIKTLQNEKLKEPLREQNKKLEGIETLQNEKSAERKWLGLDANRRVTDNVCIMVGVNNGRIRLLGIYPL